MLHEFRQTKRLFVGSLLLGAKAELRSGCLLFHCNRSRCCGQAVSFGVARRLSWQLSVTQIFYFLTLLKTFRVSVAEEVFGTGTVQFSSLSCDGSIFTIIKPKHVFSIARYSLMVLCFIYFSRNSFNYAIVYWVSFTVFYLLKVFNQYNVLYSYIYSACKNFKDSSIFSIFIYIKKFLLQPSFRMFSTYFRKLMP